MSAITDPFGKVISYEYNQDGQIKKVTVDNAVQGEYVYRDGLATTDPSYKKSSQLYQLKLAGGSLLETYTHDGYDDAEQLSTVTRNDDTVSYKYNGDGLMTERTQTVGGASTTTRYYYDGANIIAEGTVSGSTVTFKARYVRGAQLLYREDAAGNKAYYLHNGHGDVTALRQADVTLLNEYSYDIWGNPLVVSETIDNPFGYAGEYWDELTTL